MDAEIDGLEAGLERAHAFALEDPGNLLYDVVAAQLYEDAGRSDEAAAGYRRRITASGSRTRRSGRVEEQRTR